VVDQILDRVMPVARTERLDDLQGRRARPELEAQIPILTDKLLANGRRQTRRDGGEGRSPMRSAKFAHVLDADPDIPVHL
jgi:hypothetical protein